MKRWSFFFLSICRRILAVRHMNNVKRNVAERGWIVKRIAVVGSGISGLGAAHALQECHCDVIVFERERTVGGRMQTHTSQGFCWEPASQFLLDRYVTVRALMKELKLSSAPDAINSTMGVFLPPKSMFYFDMNNPFSVFQHPRLSSSAKLKQIKLFLQTLWHWNNLDFPWMRRVRKLDTDENLRTVGDREYGADAVDYFLSLPSSNMFLWRPEETPWWMAMMFLKMMFGTKMRLPAGGMGAVTKELARRLDVRTGHVVQRIEMTPEGKVTLSIVGPSGISSLTVDRVVIATPAPAALKILHNPDEALGKLRANFLRTAKYTRVMTTAVGYGSLLEKRAYGIFIPQKTNLGLSAIAWEHQKMKGRAPFGRGLGVMNTTDDFARQNWSQSDDEVAHKVISLAESIYPDSKRVVSFHKVHRYPYATPIMAPTRSRTVYEAVKEGAKPGSPVFTCGDYWLGPNVEQALITGYRAAREVLQSLDAPVPDKLHI